MPNIAIFASGNGTNAENLARYFQDNAEVNIKCVLSNREGAYVHQRMKPFGIPSITFGKEIWHEATGIAEYLRSENIDLIVLAGFLAIIQPPLLQAFHNKIINIHPSLLPKFGGVGMYGIHVHEAVVEAKETESGITIHYVSEKVDGGDIICQKKCPVYSTDTPQTLAHRVSELEYFWFPKAVEQVLAKFWANVRF